MRPVRDSDSGLRSGADFEAPQVLNDSRFPQVEFLERAEALLQSRWSRAADPVSFELLGQRRQVRNQSLRVAAELVDFRLQAGTVLRHSLEVTGLAFDPQQLDQVVDKPAELLARSLACPPRRWCGLFSS